MVLVYNYVTLPEGIVNVLQHFLAMGPWGDARINAPTSRGTTKHLDLADLAGTESRRHGSGVTHIWDFFWKMNHLWHLWEMYEKCLANVW